jgi:hypothetical protein
MNVSYDYILFSEREISRKVVLVAAVIDRYTGAQPSSDVTVGIKNSPVRALRNLSGYYVFNRLPAGEFEINVESRHYFPGQVTLKPADIGRLDPMNPLIRVYLEPNPSYPFPANATLIRGMVRDSAGHPAAGARVEITGKDNSAQTTRKGEFVLFFNTLTEEDIILEGNKKFVAGSGEKTLHLKAVHESKTGVIDIDGVLEGKTTALPAPIILSKKTDRAKSKPK